MPGAYALWGGSGLLERERELGAIDRALVAALSGEGGLPLVTGAGGIGKTALLDAARERAARDGFIVLAARGGELEGEFPYCIVRQLLETLLRSAPAGRRARLLSGAAALASPLLLGGDSDLTPSGEAAFAGLHGLYWLVVNLAAESPLAVVVDDAQWSDAASLRFLIYLARRLEGLRLALIVAMRAGESGSDPQLLQELASTPGAVRVTPGSLSESAVADLLAADFSVEPDAGFVRACSAATGGNPFLVRELAASLIADGIEPNAAAVPSVEAVGPATVAHATLGRLGHLSDKAVALARAIAVLGSDAQLPRAAKLAGLDQQQALDAFDALVGAGLVPGSGQPEFSHPIVRTAVYNELAPGVRSVTHRQIAELLAGEGADLDAIAAHLLRSQPTGSVETIATLRQAASHALSLGAPGSAVTYLARAIDEGCGRDLRTALLLELATAEQLARQPAALAHLEEVRSITTDPVTRARATIEQAMLAIYSGEWERPLALLKSALLELGERDPALALRADTTRTALTAYDPRLVSDLRPRLPALLDLALVGGAPARPLAMLLAGVGAFRGEWQDQIRELVDRGWDDGRLIEEIAGDELLPQGLYGLIICDELERAAEIVAALREAAAKRGSLVEFLIASACGSSIEASHGNLAAAEGELRAGCERALEQGVLFAIPSFLWGGVDVLLERPDTADLAALAETIELGPMAEVYNGALVLYVRGRLRFAAGEPQSAIEDLRRAGEISNALSCANPNAAAWRSALALALAPEQHDEAIDLVRGELADARRIGQPRGIGVALRALGTLEAGEQGNARLTEAVGVLAGSPARLEHARALVDLGAALRRQGSRTAARQPLRDGLDLAARCGATRLTERARTELVASGARPRRDYTASRDALTASELRVARLAAEGRTSQEIAQMLFVTTKTIDSHLQHSYTKLGINSRRQLAQALEREPD